MLVARRDAGEAPLWDVIVRTPGWDVVHAFGTAIEGWVVLVVRRHIIAVADLTNASSKRKAGTIYAGSFLEEFVDGTPWVHLDIAGTSWDVGREYVGKGASGYGVRLLVELARRHAERG